MAMTDPPPQDMPRLKRTPARKVLEGIESRIVLLGVEQKRGSVSAVHRAVSWVIPYWVTVQRPRPRPAPAALAFARDSASRATPRGTPRPS